MPEPPPPLELAGDACAGCLSFEISTGRELLLVNAGMPGPREARQPRRGARHGEPQHALPRRAVLRQADARRETGTGARRAAARHPDMSHASVREREDGGIVSRRRTTATSSTSASSTRAGSRSTRRAPGSRAATRSSAAKGGCASPGTCRSRSISSCIRRRRPRRPTAGRRRARAGQRRAMAPDGRGRCLSIEESTYYADVSGRGARAAGGAAGQCYGATEVSWVLSDRSLGSRARAGKQAAPAAGRSPSARPRPRRLDRRPQSELKACKLSSRCVASGVPSFNEYTRPPVSRQKSMLTGA